MNTVVELLEFAETAHGARVAAEELATGRTVSHAELVGAGRRVATGLHAHGVTTGDRAVVLMRNSIEFLEIEIALAMAGLVKAALPHGTSEDDLERLLTFLEPAVVLIEAEECERLSAVLAGLDSVRLLVVSSEVRAGTGPASRVAYAELRNSPPGPLPSVSGDDPFILRFTSGTTDRPKAVLHDQRGFAAVVANQLYAMNWGTYVGTEDRFLQFLPLSAGTIFWFYSSLVAGATTVITDGFEPAQTLATIERSDTTCTFLVPPMLNAMVSAASGAPRARSLRTVFVGGTPMPSAQLRSATEVFGNVFVHYYGASEYPVCTITTRRGEEPLQSDPRGPASCGRPALGTRIAVVDDDDQQVPPGTIGNLLVGGTHVFREYWSNAAATERSKLPGGWVRTDDMAKVDEDGNVFLIDRRQNVIPVGDHVVVPGDVEEVFAQLPGVSDVLVLGIEGAGAAGPELVAVVVPDPGDAIDAVRLLDAARPNLHAHEVPHRVVLRTEPFPRSPLGKVQRHEVARALQTETSATR